MNTFVFCRTEGKKKVLPGPQKEVDSDSLEQNATSMYSRAREPNFVIVTARPMPPGTPHTVYRVKSGKLNESKA